jgi:uncharacterized protein YqgC (DUF456 family)
MPEWGSWVALAVMLVGLVGTILPAVPGITLIWAALLVYGIVDRFATLTPAVFVVLTLLAATAVVSDLVFTHAASRIAGASWQAIAAGLVLGAAGFVLGFFVGGIGAVPAGVIGTLVGIVGVEYVHRRNLAEAIRAGGGWLAGCLASRLVQFMIGLVMIGVFVWRTGVAG